MEAGTDAVRGESALLGNSTADLRTMANLLPRGARSFLSQQERAPLSPKSLGKLSQKAIQPLWIQSRPKLWMVEEYAID